MRNETVIGALAVIAMITVMSLGSFATFASVTTGAVVASVNQCHKTLGSNGIISTACDYQGPADPSFRLKPGTIPFIASNNQQGNVFGAGQSYHKRMQRLATRDQMSSSGGRKIGVISRSDGNVLFSNERYMSRHYPARVFEDEGKPIQY